MSNFPKTTNPLSKTTSPSHVSPQPNNLHNNHLTNSIRIIASAGRLLLLPQVAIAKASILFYKCIQRSSNLKNNVFEDKEFFLAMACCFLGTKSEESLRQYRDVLMVFDRIFQKALSLQKEEVDKIFEFQNETRFYRWRKLLFHAEFEALRLLGHILNYENAYKFLLSYLNALHLDDMPAQFFQRAWNYLNDSLFSPLCLLTRPEVLACASIHLAALEFGLALPRAPHCWHLFFDVSAAELRGCCDAILSRYFLGEEAFRVTSDVRKELELSKALEQKNKRKVKLQIEELKEKIKGVSSLSREDINKPKSPESRPNGGRHSAAKSYSARRSRPRRSYGRKNYVRGYEERSERERRQDRKRRSSRRRGERRGFRSPVKSVHSKGKGKTADGKPKRFGKPSDPTEGKIWKAKGSKIIPRESVGAGRKLSEKCTEPKIAKEMVKTQNTPREKTVSNKTFFFGQKTQVSPPQMMAISFKAKGEKGVIAEKLAKKVAEEQKRAKSRLFRGRRVKPVKFSLRLFEWFVEKKLRLLTKIYF